MAFVDSFSHDVFISYAQVDNQALIPGDEHSKWVSTLRNYLQTLLDQKLGRRGAASIWMDLSGIQGNEPLSRDIRDAVTGSSTLVTVISEGYLTSPWCAQERELFIEGAGGREGAAKRIFLVRRDSIPHDDGRWPAEFGELLGYPFFNRDLGTGLVQTLGVPRPDPAEKDYFIRLDRLRTDLASQLKEMKHTGRTGFARPDGGTATSPVALSIETGPITPASVTDQNAICLAEVTPDLTESRESVKRYLEQQGWRVLPGRFYPRDPARFRAAQEKDLAESVLFVQMLGPWCSSRTEEMPDGLEGLQIETARAAGIETLRWRSQELDPESVSDQTHRAFIREADVIATDLEELKALTAREARSVQSRQSVSAPPNGGGRFVLLNAESGDVALADRIAAKLEAMNLGFDIVDDETPLSDLTESDDYDGLMVIYGACSQDWVQDRVRECRRVALRKKSQAPVCAVFVGPPDEKTPLRTRPPRFHIIEEENEARFQAFLDAIEAKGSAA